MIQFDRNKFNTIDTPEECYWIGFIQADGYIPLNSYKNPSGIKIKLNSIDEEHLIKFILFMGGKVEECLKHERHSTTNNLLSYVNFCSRQVADNLGKYGIYNHKSGQEKFIFNLPYLRDYIRGLIDGDGFICSTRPGVGLVGSFDICSNVQKHFEKELNIKPKKIHTHGVIYKIEYHSKKEVENILSYLYQEGDVALDRKVKLTEKIC